MRFILIGLLSSLIISCGGTGGEQLRLASICEDKMKSLDYFTPEHVQEPITLSTHPNDTSTVSTSEAGIFRFKSAQIHVLDPNYFSVLLDKKRVSQLLFQITQLPEQTPTKKEPFPFTHVSSTGCVKGLAPSSIGEISHSLELPLALTLENSKAPILSTESSTIEINVPKTGLELLIDQVLPENSDTAKSDNIELGELLKLNSDEINFLKYVPDPEDKNQTSSSFPNLNLFQLQQSYTDETGATFIVVANYEKCISPGTKPPASKNANEPDEKTKAWNERNSKYESCMNYIKIRGINDQKSK